MEEIRIYEYNSENEANGYRGTDYSSHVLQGAQLVEKLNQELDTAEITLSGLDKKEEFTPGTKFIVDIYQDGLLLSGATYHFCVSRDIVSQPVLSDEHYFDHHISLIEPSVVAQKRLVDNISATYQLKDVTLYEPVSYPPTEIVYNIANSYFEPPYYSTTYGQSNYFGSTTAYMRLPLGNAEAQRSTFGKYFRVPSGDSFRVINPNGVEYSTIYNNILDFWDANTNTYKAKFKIPRLEILNGFRGMDEWSDFELDDARIFDPMYASIDYTINEYTSTDNTNPTNTWSGSFISNSRLGYSSDGYEQNSVNFQSNFQTEILDYEWFVEDIRQDGNGYFEFYYKKYTDTNATTPDYITQEIEIQKNRNYVITISLHQFPDNLPSTYNGTRRYKYENTSPILSYWSGVYTSNPNSTGEFISAWDYAENIPAKRLMTDAQITGSVENFFYDSIGIGIIQYSHAIPYSALALLQKAIINSGLYEKEPNVYIADVNNSNLPFYIDPTFVDELRLTTVIENFYNQKNLWEIMVEVGNYIHAIPELKFGSNDRFMITFNRLGITDESQNNSTKISIFNSRSVEDYVCSVSSYISNMVQLGGYVEEWVSPKTTNETMLVSNDTAEIVVSKPIIELLDITVRNNTTGITASMTNYVYEENVYKTLDIKYSVNPNKGIAMYYKLGTNVITGGNYQTPQKYTTLYSDYTFKKIIYCAFANTYPIVDPYTIPGPSSPWENIQVNDYSFLVKYRTKDSVRQNHSRPDLRKYLMSSKWDKYPEHNQFNNQTDVVVDSIKFGNNMFGKLIKTGNNSYEIQEWNNNWTTIKHKGELYRINDELYYVAKVTHTFYDTHIISEVSYSKDYNELSNVIGIPSEPRFYEISEQSLIWREFSIDDLLLLTDDPNQLNYGSNYLLNYDHLANLVIGEGTDFAKYAVSVFKGDRDTNIYDQTIGEGNFYTEVMHPINAYSSENTLTYEYDMLDNYSAGDKIIAADAPTGAYYNSLLATKYTDKYGRSALFDFYILGNTSTPTPEQTKALPESFIDTKDNTNINYVGKYDVLATNVKQFDTNYNGRGIGLLKDCREAISVNYNLKMITNSHTFVLSPYVYLPKKGNLRLVLLANEVNKLSNGYIDNGSIITPLDTNGNPMSQYFDYANITGAIDKPTTTNSLNNQSTVVTSFGIKLNKVFEDVANGHFTGEEGYQRVKAIAILCDVSFAPGENTENSSIPYRTQFIVARNIPSDWTREEALSEWYWGAPNKDTVFTNKQ